MPSSSSSSQRPNYESGQSIAQAALGAARLRFRPIVMTALAFIFGCLPLWIATGAGAASRQILGTVVIGGMILSTVLGLIFIPASFSTVEWISHRFGKGGKGTTMDSKHDPEITENEGEADRASTSRHDSQTGGQA